MRDYWSYCGEIEKLDVMRFPDSGRFKGIAFITFAEVCCLSRGWDRATDRAP